MHIFYDAHSKPSMIRYNGTDYRYVYNLQGDVIALVDQNGSQVVEYTYDAWGSKKSVTGSLASSLGTENPFRYRGYIYDEETWMYYCRSRYYYPELQRFISADDIAVLGASPMDLTDKNLFAYCDNNPIIRGDNGGKFWHIVVGAVIGGLFELGSQLIANDGKIGEVNWGKVGVATAVGGITAACGPALGASISGLGNVVIERLGGETDTGKLLTSFAVGAGSSLIGTGVGKVAQKVGGKIAVNSLAKKAPGQIKKIVNSAVSVAGRDRNTVKNLTWTLTQGAYKSLPNALLGKSIPQAFNSAAVGFSGYGTMGVIYGFR